MRESKYVSSLFPQRAVEGVITAKNVKPNGLLRANERAERASSNRRELRP